jgi:hypothetical protein
MNRSCRRCRRDARRDPPFYSEVSLVTRTAGSVEPTISALRASLQRADPALPVAKTEELAEIVNDRFNRGVSA